MKFHTPVLESHKLETHNILIVDDMPVNLSVIVDFLQSYGFGIRIARSGESALKRVHYDPPDLILLDILMPGIDGFETCRQLQENEATKDIPIIFMTSLTSVEDKVRGFEAGAVDYVTKPLDQNEVLARVRTHLRLLDAARELQQQNRDLKMVSQTEKARLFEAVNQQREQLRSLTTRLTEVQEDERKQLARELHDELGQALTAISINLETIKKEVPNNASIKLCRSLEESILLTMQTLDQVREMSLSLRPPMLDDLGLIPTLHWYLKQYAERVDIEARFGVEGLDSRLPPEIEITLYRIVQEALTNVARHSGASTVNLSLKEVAHNIQVIIEDNGCGFNLHTVLNQKLPNQGAGLVGIRERTTLLCGEFDIQTTSGQGTRLSISIPLNGYGTN